MNYRNETEEVKNLVITSISLNSFLSKFKGIYPNKYTDLEKALSYEIGIEIYGTCFWENKNKYIRIEKLKTILNKKSD